MKYDYLVVGAGLFGAVFANEMKQAGKKCLVIDRRSHIAGNIYTENVRGINVHKYGAHIFHTQVTHRCLCRQGRAPVPQDSAGL